jgi:hypothetical protein
MALRAAAQQKPEATGKWNPAMGIRGFNQSEEDLCGEDKSIKGSPSTSDLGTIDRITTKE